MRILLVISALSIAACGDGDIHAPGDAGATDAGAQLLNCESTRAGCFCSATAVDELAECSAASVAAGLQLGYCCSGAAGGAPYCSCETVECRTDGPSCACGRTEIVETLGTLTATCDGAHCCVINGGTCFCSSPVCRPGEPEVPSCATTDVTDCRAGETLTDLCL